MTQLNPLILTVTLLVLVVGAGAQDERNFGDSFPLEQCLSQRVKDALKVKLCGDLGLADADCIAQEGRIRTCQLSIMQGAQGSAVINTSADCFQSVTGINVPSAAREDPRVLAAIVEEALQTNRRSLCAQTLQLLYCFTSRTNINQLIRNCLAGINK